MKISIVTVVYNNEKDIENCMQSVFDQSCANKEYIVVDGGSTDSTCKKINGANGKITRFISESDKGIYDALNKGVKLSSGEIIGFLHSDDVYANTNVLENVSNLFVMNNVDVVYGDLQYINGTRNILRNWISRDFNRKLLRKGWMPPHPTLFVKRSLFDQLGKFDTNFKIAADYDWMLRVLSKPGIKAAYIPEVLVKMKWGGASNRSIKNILLKMKEDYKAIRRNKCGGLNTLIMKNLSKLKQFI